MSYVVCLSIEQWLVFWGRKVVSCDLKHKRLTLILIGIINLITDFSSSTESKYFLTLFTLWEVMNYITLLSSFYDFFPLNFKGYPSVLADHYWTIQSIHTNSFYYIWLLWLYIFGLLPIPMPFLRHSNQKSCNTSTMTLVGYTSWPTVA